MTHPVTDIPSEPSTDASVGVTLTAGWTELRDLEIGWVADQLGDAISNLGYPVGMGIAPNPETMKLAATKLVDRWTGISEMMLRAKATGQ